MLCLAIALLGAACGGGGDGGDGSSGKTLEVRFDYANSVAENAGVFRNAKVEPGDLAGLEGETPTFRLVSGVLPAGMKLDSHTGVLSGVPTENGRFEATVRLTVDGYDGSVEATAVVEVGELQFDYQPYDDSFPLQVAVGAETEPVLPNLGTLAKGVKVRFALEDGSHLPDGMTLDPATGAIGGTPTQVNQSASATIVATFRRGGKTITAQTRLSLFVDINESDS